MKRYTKFAGGRGFTLIELLVVIAIIGILSSVVLVSLNSARKKGTDTRVISDVQEARTALESGFTTGYYPDLYNTTASGSNLVALVTTNGPDISNINQLGVDAAKSNTSGLIYVINTNSTAGTATQGNASAYAIYGLLTAPSTTSYFCIDSNGKTNVAAAAAVTTSCP